MKKIILGVVCLISLQTYAQKNKTALNLSSDRKIVLTPGQVISTVSSANIETAMNMGMPMNIKNDMTMKSTMTVLSENTEDYEVSVKLTGMKMAVEAPGQNMNFDSEKPEDASSEIGQGIMGKLNTPMSFIVSKKTGKATAKNPDDASSESNPFSGGGTDPSQILADMVFPISASSKPGEQWMDSVTIGNLKTINNYKLKSVDNGIATVELNAQIDGTKDVNIQGSPTTMTMSTKATSTITVNTATGLVVKKELTSSSDASMEMMGNNIPMTITVNSSTENK